MRSQNSFLCSIAFLLLFIACEQKNNKKSLQVTPDTVEKLNKEIDEKEKSKKTIQLHSSDSVVTRNHGGGDLDVSVEAYYKNQKLKKILEIGGTGEYNDFRNIFYFSDGKFCASHLYHRESIYIDGEHRTYFMEAKYDFVDSTFQYKYDSTSNSDFIALPFDTVSFSYDSLKTAQQRAVNQLLYESQSEGKFSYLFVEISAANDGSYDLEVQPFYSDYTELIWVKEKDSFIDSLLSGLVQVGDTIQLRCKDEIHPDENFLFRTYQTKN